MITGNNTKINKKTECPHCKFINSLFFKVETNREYWLYTEIFVYLHDGKDYCNYEETQQVLTNIQNKCNI